MMIFTKNLYPGCTWGTAEIHVKIGYSDTFFTKLYFPVIFAT